MSTIGGAFEVSYRAAAAWNYSRVRTTWQDFPKINNVNVIIRHTWAEQWVGPEQEIFDSNDVARKVKKDDTE